MKTMKNKLGHALSIIMGIAGIFVATGLVAQTTRTGTTGVSEACLLQADDEMLRTIGMDEVQWQKFNNLRMKCEHRAKATQNDADRSEAMDTHDQVLRDILRGDQYDVFVTWCNGREKPAGKK